MAKINWKRILLNGVLRLLARRKFRNRYTVNAVRGLLGKFDRPVKLPENIRHRAESIVDLQCEWFEPEGIDSDSPLLVYFPGGGFILPATGAHRKMIEHICVENKCRGLLAQYRLGSDHRMPTAQTDGLNVYSYLVEQLGENPDTIFMMGDSAGGGVALSTLLQVRDAGLPLPAGAVLLSPWTDLTFAGDGLFDNLNKDPLFHISAFLWMLKHSKPENLALNDPLVSPAFGDFSNLPPLLLEVGSTELLLDSSRTVAKRAREKQVEVELTISPYSPHIYPVLGFLPEAQAARQRINQFIQRHLVTSAVKP